MHMQMRAQSMAAIGIPPRDTTRAHMHSLFGVSMSYTFPVAFCSPSIRSRVAVQVSLAAQAVHLIGQIALTGRPCGGDRVALVSFFEQKSASKFGFCLPVLFA